MIHLMLIIDAPWTYGKEGEIACNIFLTLVDRQAFAVTIL
jgi:hypothetical protein